MEVVAQVQLESGSGWMKLDRRARPVGEALVDVMVTAHSSMCVVCFWLKLLLALRVSFTVIGVLQLLSLSVIRVFQNGLSLK